MVQQKILKTKKFRSENNKLSNKIEKGRSENKIALTLPHGQF